MTTTTFNAGELTMLRFLELCVSSLDPDSYHNVLGACDLLCKARENLTDRSLLKCLKQINGNAYDKPKQRPSSVASTPLSVRRLLRATLEVVGDILGSKGRPTQTQLEDLRTLYEDAENILYRKSSNTERTGP